MKFCKISLFLALLVAVCLPAVGQTALRIDIPFNFIALGKSLPAGHYQVARLPNSFSIWSLSDGHNGVVASTSPVDSNQKTHRPSLVFLRTGETYSLIQIWNGNTGLNVPQWNVKQTLVSKDEPKPGEYIEIAAK